jgi:hypothetical protein
MTAAEALLIAPESTLVAVRIFDCAFAVRESPYDTHLMAAAALVIATKAHQRIPADFCSQVAEQFAGVDLQMLVNEELALFLLIGLDAYVPASLHCARILVTDGNDEVLNTTVKICLCAAGKFECSVFAGAEIGKEAVEIARELVGNGFDVERVGVANQCRQAIVQALKDGGAFSG